MSQLGTGYHQTGAGAIVTFSELGSFHLLEVSPFGGRAFGVVKTDGLNETPRYHVDPKRATFQPVRLRVYHRPDQWELETPPEEFDLTLTYPYVDGFITQQVVRSKARLLLQEFPLLRLNLPMVSGLVFQPTENLIVTPATPRPPDV